jgi:hypothetical protein
MGETISFAPRKAIKSQVLADFVAEWVDTQLPTTPIQPEFWTMFFDGSESAFIPFVSFGDLHNNTFKGLTSLLSVEQEIQYDEHT